MNAAKDQVIIVNERNEWMGTMDKLTAHKEGALHRAISIFVMNSKNQLLIQQRADGKYHSGGLWSNTCCSHPMNGESTMAAAHRRLQEEMGFDCKLEQAFVLRYEAAMDNGLVENEYDNIFSGRYDGEVNINPEEVKAYRYIDIEELAVWMEKEPAAFTAWLHLALPKFVAYLDDDRGSAAA